jgi:hypothetical protein
LILHYASADHPGSATDARVARPVSAPPGAARAEVTGNVVLCRTGKVILRQSGMARNIRRNHGAGGSV